MIHKHISMLLIQQTTFRVEIYINYNNHSVTIELYNANLKKQNVEYLQWKHLALFADSPQPASKPISVYKLSSLSV